MPFMLAWAPAFLGQGVRTDRTHVQKILSGLLTFRLVVSAACIISGSGPQMPLLSVPNTKRWGNWGSERESNLSRVTQQGTGLELWSPDLQVRDPPFSHPK